MKSHYKVIGVMAGSSMDGLDVAEVEFNKNGSWTFELIRSRSYAYDKKISNDLIKAVSQSLDEQKRVNQLFGEWISDKLLDFGVEGNDLVAVHGHTITHKPDEGISWQLGDGSVIANETKVPAVTDFRSLDVTLGGQGAPLVPVGDFQLLSTFDACLNLGGIANVSIRDKRIAWDVCPCNQVLNFFAKKLGKEFDKNGDLAREGNNDQNWKARISENPFYDQLPPKSLPNQFIESQILDEVNPSAGLRTYSEFISERVIHDINTHLNSGAKIFTSGGGAFNSFLIELLNANEYGLEFHVPKSELVAFKEAVVFGFLGILKTRNEPNVLASVTGAIKDTSSGIIHYPK